MSRICSCSSNIEKKGFKKYSELISCFLVAEQNNELLMKNHDSRLTGTTSFPEVNAVFSNNNGRGRGRGRSHNCGKGRSNYTFCGNTHSDSKKTTQMMIIQEKLHKIINLKVVKINAFVVV